MRAQRMAGHRRLLRGRLEEGIALLVACQWLSIASADNATAQDEEPTVLTTRTTKMLSDRDLRHRKLLYGGVIGGSCLLVIILGLRVATMRLKHKFDKNSLQAFADELPDESSGAFESSDASESSEQSAFLDPVDAEQDEQHDAFGVLRSTVLIGLFVLYVGCATLTPPLSFSTLTCEAGFFWETHMIFLAVFVLTKVCELLFYAYDPTLSPALPVVSSGDTIYSSFCGLQVTNGFLWKFTMSFMGYIDAYQDSISIAIAFACPDPVAQSLAWAMLGIYVAGVIILQWVVVAIFAFRDPTKACFFKLLHMDSVAARISLPEDEQFTWRLLHGSRTMAEDVPQAILQCIYVVRVKRNYFMIFSICCAVGASLLAMKDALTRALYAAGAAEEQLKSIHVNWGWAIHGVIFETVGNSVEGRLVDNAGRDMDLKEWKQRGGGHSMYLEPGEWVTRVQGYNLTGEHYLCYEIKFVTNLGRSKKFTAKQPYWKGERFEYHASPGHAISECNFDSESGRCVGIKQIIAVPAPS